MGFETLLGNDRLKENLSRSLARGHISHFYLICGPEGSGKRTLARLLAAAILCKGADKPCHQCLPCRKVAEGNHPDCITVDDPEKKTVPVELIRQARADMYVLPNESDHKIYVFPRAQDMGLPGQNALLKVLEEPPEYGVFLLLTDNPDKLLPTVRSRCVELRLQALPEPVLRSALAKEFPEAGGEDLAAAMQRSGGFLGQARILLREGGAALPQTAALVQALSEKDSLQLMNVLVPMEKWKRDDLAAILAQWQTLLEEALVCRSGAEAVSKLARQLARERTGEELLDCIAHVQKALEYTQSNVSPGAVCGYLEWTLRGPGR